MSDYIPERDAALAAVRAAAVLTEAVRAELEPRALEKGDRSPVTVADFGAQALACRVLRATHPDDPVLGEESSMLLRQPEHHRELTDVVARVAQALAAEEEQPPGMGQVCGWIDHGRPAHDAPGAVPARYWTLDPIDGTKGFLRGDQYAIALALVEDGRPRAAALACPALPRTTASDAPRGAVFTAVAGGAAEVWPLAGDGAGPSPIAVSTVDDPAGARLTESVDPGHSSHRWSAEVAKTLGVTRQPRRIDSQAKYAVVARGEAEVYLRLPTTPDYVERIWDHAAGALIVETAGGRVTDLDGQRLDFSRGLGLEGQRGVVATNGRLHAAVLEAL